MPHTCISAVVISRRRTLCATGYILAGLKSIDLELCIVRLIVKAMYPKFYMRCTTECKYAKEGCCELYGVALPLHNECYNWYYAW